MGEYASSLIEQFPQMPEKLGFVSWVYMIGSVVLFYSILTDLKMPRWPALMAWHPMCAFGIILIISSTLTLRKRKVTS
ncbi:hypothetical protein [uncultured Roseobacter sp.]|uniref:hypothetical protein n=1 Tax=uncultured Roseobacter sp. TaxID=114847 RepID=UPI0026131778|nr:hypothetical protein [uncultured Roseobacter sp.]